MEYIYFFTRKFAKHLSKNFTVQIYIIIIHQNMLYELMSNLIGSLLLYYDFILH